MDGLVLSNSIVALLTWFVTKTGEGVAQKVGEEVYLLLQSKFQNSREATSMLHHFTENPERYREVIVSIIQEAIKKDPKFASAVLNLLEQSNYQQRRGKNTTQIATGDGIIQQEGENLKAISKVTKRSSKS